MIIRQQKEVGIYLYPHHFFLTFHACSLNFVSAKCKCNDLCGLQLDH